MSVSASEEHRAFLRVNSHFVIRPLRRPECQGTRFEAQYVRIKTDSYYLIILKCLFSAQEVYGLVPIYKYRTHFKS